MPDSQITAGYFCPNFTNPNHIRPGGPALRKKGAGRLASDDYPDGINVLAPHFHAAAGALSRPLPRHP